MKFLSVLSLLAIGVSLFGDGVTAEDNPCTHPGFFPLSDNSANYYGCYANKYGGLTKKYLSCVDGQIFLAKKGYCGHRVLQFANEKSSTDSPEVENPTVPTEKPAETESTAKPEEPKTEKPAETESTVTVPKETESTEKPEETTTEKSVETESTVTVPEETDSTEKPEETTTENPVDTESTVTVPEESDSTEKPEETTTEKSAETEPTTTTADPEGNETTTEKSDDTTAENETTESTESSDENVTTTTEVSEEKSTTPADNETTTEDGDTTTNNTEEPTTTNVPVNDFFCPTSGFFPQDGSCDQFNYCTEIEGELKAFKRSCPEGQNFNPFEGFCTASYKCKSLVSSRSNDELECLIEGNFVYHNDCSRYYKCLWDESSEGFKSQVIQCPQGEVYHTLTNRCGVESTLTCLGRPLNSKFHG